VRTTAVREFDQRVLDVLASIAKPTKTVDLARAVDNEDVDRVREALQRLERDGLVESEYPDGCGVRHYRHVRL
jgi:predicted MarR family transcription regulator